MPTNKRQWLNFSVVFVGNGITPSKYDPEYLLKSGIVSADWNWKSAGASQLGPLGAVVLYNDGKYTIRVEKTKVTIIEEVRSIDEISNSRIGEFATNFIDRSQHIAFKGIGLNYSFIERDIEEAFILRSFVKDHFHVVGGHTAQRAALKLVFPFNSERGILVLSLDPADLEINYPPNDPQRLKGVLVQANFHQDMEDDKEIKATIESRETTLKLLEAISNGLFE